MSVREYVGARYIPLFADPLTWDATRTYEPLTVVLYQGNSYTSRQTVPANIDISNTTYWAQTGNYNAQIEQYRQEVTQYNGRISACEDGLPVTTFNAQNTVEDAIGELGDLLPASDFDSTNTVKAAIDGIDSRVDTLELPDYCVWIGDSYSVGTYAHGSTMQPVVEIPKRLGLTCKNYSVGGAGWLRGDLTNGFLGQINTAVADTTLPSERVKYAFIFGGLNDVTQIGQQSDWNPETIKTRMRTGLATLQTNFPNARIVVVGINSASLPGAPSNVSLNFTDNAWNEMCCSLLYERICAEKGVAYIDVTMANLFTPSHFDVNDGHPNDTGYRELDYYIWCGLNGTKPTSRKGFIIGNNIPNTYSQYEVVSPYDVTIAAGNITYTNPTPAQTFNNAVLNDGVITGIFNMNISARSGATQVIDVRFPNNIAGAPLEKQCSRDIVYGAKDYVGYSVTPWVEHNLITGFRIALKGNETSAFNLEFTYSFRFAN